LALIARDGHPETVEIIVVLTFLVLAGVVSIMGPDSHDLDDRDRRGWWPGHSR
jgi:hypothetical protein